MKKKKYLIPLIMLLLLAIGGGTFAYVAKYNKEHPPTGAGIAAARLQTLASKRDISSLFSPEDYDFSYHIVAIDAGHQARGNSEHEPIGPGASQTKPKVASGTAGKATGVPEYQLTLDISLKLKEELQKRGYVVVMIRETNDVNISNSKRAEIANNSGAEIFIRIHANGSENSATSGALTMAPSAKNRYIGNIASACKSLSKYILDSYCAATGFQKIGVVTTDTMSGINWCKIPVTIVEMGFMSNHTEDTAMQSPKKQTAMVNGIADGIDAYFNSLEQ